jgi:hypothetical protein
MRCGVLLCAVGLALVMAGCGSGSGAGDKSANGVRATMRAFLEDLRNSRGGDACDLMTDAERAKEGQGDTAACGPRVLLVRAFLGDKAIADLEAKLGQLPVTITGDHATAPPLTGSGAGSTFVYSGGRWLIGRNS